MTTLTTTGIGKRVTLVDRIGAGGNGDSLDGQNVNNFEEGALFYVRASNRFYALRKNLDSLVVPNGLFNVVDGIGSSAAAGRFIAVQQWGTATLGAGGTVLSTGWDSTAGGFFDCSYVTPGGTQGFLHGAKTANNSMTVTSSSSSDTSVVLIVFYELPQVV